MNGEYWLRLYITGRTAHSMRAIDNLRRICDEELDGLYQIEVIDILENPRLAEDQKILATPTLVKQLPEPVRKIIGDLSDRERVLLGLDLVTARRNAAQETPREAAPRKDATQEGDE